MVNNVPKTNRIPSTPKMSAKSQTFDVFGIKMNRIKVKQICYRFVNFDNVINCKQFHLSLDKV